MKFPQVVTRVVTPKVLLNFWFFFFFFRLLRKGNISKLRVIPFMLLVYKGYLFTLNICGPDPSSPYFVFSLILPIV